MNKAIFYFNSKPIMQKDIENSLLEIGLRKGDIIMVHSDLSSFGKLGDVKDKNEFIKDILDSFRNVIGKEGTLIVPTYNTESFCKYKIYDVNKTISTAGIFTEFVRKLATSIRSEDPIHSHAGIGKYAEKLLKDVGDESFGEDSFFDRFYRLNGKIVNFGTQFNKVTFIHYIETKFKVNYRFNKKFSGIIIKKDGSKKKKEIIYYVRYLPEDGMDVEYDINNMELLGSELEKRAFLKKIKLGNGYISCCNAKDCYEVGMDMLRKNEYVFLKNKPNVFAHKPFF